MNALFNKAIVILQAMPAVKFVIVLPDGATITQGDLQLEQTKQRTRNFKYPVGSVCRYYKPYVADLQVGQMVEIPYLQDIVDYECMSCTGTGVELDKDQVKERIEEITDMIEGMHIRMNGHSRFIMQLKKGLLHELADKYVDRLDTCSRALGRLINYKKKLDNLVG